MSLSVQLRSCHVRTFQGGRDALHSRELSGVLDMTTVDIQRMTVSICSVTLCGLVAQQVNDERLLGCMQAVDEALAPWTCRMFCIVYSGGAIEKKEMAMCADLFKAMGLYHVG